MRRITAICTTLILLLGAAAFAEDAGRAVTDFEDFILRTDVPPEFRAEKADGQPLFLLYLPGEGNISLAAVNAVWNRDTEKMDPEAFAEMHRAAEEGIRAQYEAIGRELKSCRIGETVETELWGMPALVCDAELIVGFNDTEAYLVRRGIRVTGAFGSYTFSLSAWSQEHLEQATAALAEALRWK